MGFMYIMTNWTRSVLYIGVTSNWQKRVAQHKNKEIEGFTTRYNVIFCVYIEQHQTIRQAIAREKQLKKWNRAWKVELIVSLNPEWKDLLTGKIVGVCEDGFPLSRE